MQKIYLVLIGLLLCSSGFGQNKLKDKFKYKVTYELTYQPDSTDASSVTSEEMWLYIGDNVSKFSSKGKALKDSLASRKNKSAGGMVDFKTRVRMTETEFDYGIYKNFPEDRISYTLKIVTDRLRYEEDKELFDWEIFPETKTIQGYKSQKVQTVFRGRKYTAWFTSEISISDGPYKFHGLPGLIIQLQDNEADYVFKLIELKRLHTPIPVELDPAAYMLTSREKLLQVKREYDEDPLSGIEKRNSAVSITVVDKERRQYLKELREELEKKNNPIELE